MRWNFLSRLILPKSTSPSGGPSKTVVRSLRARTSPNLHGSCPKFGLPHQTMARFHSARRSGTHSIGQWAGVHRQGAAGLDRRGRCQDRLHRARQSVGERFRGEFQRSASRRTARRRDLLHVERGPDHDRKLATKLQRHSPACLARLQTAGAGSVRPALAAWPSARNRSDGHASAGAETAAKLTLQLDHSMGADQ